MTRFLRYAIEHGRKLRMVLMLNGAIVQKTVRVESCSPDSAVIYIGASRKPTEIPLADILSCDYARGDHGD